MIQIIVQAQKASCRKSSGERITTGMVGKQVSFDFSAEWDVLVKTAVFEGSGVKKDVTLSGDTAVIPHECLTAPGGMLRVGVFGTDGTTQTPTVYTDIGQIEQGADPSGDTSADPTLPIWAQLQAMMGDLSSLTTTAKENLVAAINEAAKSGGAAADVRMQVAGGYIQYSSDGGANWNNLIAVAELIGPTDETLTKSGQAADSAVVGNRFSALSEEIVTTSESKVAAHNTGTDTHSDIRLLIQGLTDRLNALADSDDTTLDQLSEVVAYIKSNRSLIEAITTSKVSVADIIDNLTSNVANKPLSAAQGVALKALIDAITVPDKLPNPHPLTFTGAVTGSYDGSEPLTVNIPSSGGSGGSAEPGYKDATTLFNVTLDDTTGGLKSYEYDVSGIEKTDVIIINILFPESYSGQITITNQSGAELTREFPNSVKGMVIGLKVMNGRYMHSCAYSGNTASRIDAPLSLFYGQLNGSSGFVRPKAPDTITKLKFTLSVAFVSGTQIRAYRW